MKNHVKIEVKPNLISSIHVKPEDIKIDPDGPENRPKKKRRKKSKNDRLLEDLGDGNHLCDQCPFFGSKTDLVWHVNHAHSNR